MGLLKETYHEKFSLAKHNISKSWNVIKSIINKDHFKNTINEIKNDNTSITNKNLIANHFNDYEGGI